MFWHFVFTVCCYVSFALEVTARAYMPYVRYILKRTLSFSTHTFFAVHVHGLSYIGSNFHFYVCKDCDGSVACGGI